MSDKQPCRTCSSTEYNRCNIFYQGDKLVEVCNKCTELGQVWLPDQYLPDGCKQQTDPNITDRAGNPIPFSSKREKELIMRQLNIGYAESNERVHGGRNFDSKASKQWKGIDKL